MLVTLVLKAKEDNFQSGFLRVLVALYPKRKILVGEEVVRCGLQDWNIIEHIWYIYEPKTGTISSPEILEMPFHSTCQS
jgi:hypothetical protein